MVQRKFGIFDSKLACFSNGLTNKTPIKIYYASLNEALQDAEEYMKKSEYDWIQIWDMRQIRGTRVSRWIRQDRLEFIEVEI